MTGYKFGERVYLVDIKETGKAYQRIGKASANRLASKIRKSGQHAKIVKWGK